MRPHLLAPWLLLLFMAVPGTQSSAQAAPAARDAQALATAALAGLPGTASAGVLAGDQVRVAVRGAASPKAPEPIFEIGSISKVFTGLLLAQAVERGELSQDDTVGRLLGAAAPFDSKPMAARTAAITLRQLVTHTSCLPFMPDSPNVVPAEAQLTSYTRAELWSALGKVALARSAPCDSAYSNFGMAVLAELLAQRAGAPWGELVRTRIAAPLGMRDTFLKVPARQASRVPAGFVRDVPARPWAMDAFAGTGGLQSTATDLLIFSRALLQGRRGPLGAAAERLVSDIARYGRAGGRIGYAVILPAAPEPVWAHNGVTGGHVAEWVVWPQRKEAVVILVSNLASPARVMARGLIAGK